MMGAGLAAHVGLVKSIAARYQWAVGGSVGFDDLMQAGLMGLAEGLQHFDPTRGTKASTYLWPWIRAAIQREVQNNSRTVRLPHHRWVRRQVPPQCSLDVPIESGADASTWLDLLASDEPSPEELALSGERAAVVRAALDRLPERTSAIVVATVVEELPCDEAGARLPTPISKERARQLRHEGMNKLRAWCGRV